MKSKKVFVELAARDVISGSVNLPSPPEVYGRITQVLELPDWTPADIGRVVETDPSLTARILKLVNSPFYGLYYKVDSISRAIAFIGVRELQNLVLATSMVDAFTGIDYEDFSLSEFWRNNLLDAVVAKVLASHHVARTQLDSIFVAVLLKNIGQLVIFQAVPELARESIAVHETESVSLYEAEKQVIGCDHGEVGAELMAQWYFPEALRTVARCHISPQGCSASDLRPAWIAALAVEIARHIRSGKKTALDQLKASTLWSNAGLENNILEDVLEVSQAAFDEALRAILH